MILPQSPRFCIQIWRCHKTLLREPARKPDCVSISFTISRDTQSDPHLSPSTETFDDSLLTNHFDTQVYHPDNKAITLISKHIRNKASAALHAKQATWAFNLTPFTTGIRDPEDGVRVLAHRMMFVKTIEIRYDHILILLFYHLHSSNVLARQADSPRCQIYCYVYKLHRLREYHKISGVRKTHGIVL